MRGAQAIKNYLFSVLYGFVLLQKMTAMDLIGNDYRLWHDLFNEVIAAFIIGFYARQGPARSTILSCR